MESATDVMRIVSAYGLVAWLVICLKLYKEIIFTYELDNVKPYGRPSSFNRNTKS